MDYVVTDRHIRPDHLPKYDSLADAPDDLRTKENWLRNGRRLKSGAEPAGLLRDPECQFYHRKLFSFDNTRCRTPKEKAVDVVWDVFVKGHSGPYILWNDAKSHWQEVGRGFVPRGLADHLRKGDLTAHLDHRLVVGVIGHGKYTRFVAIDLDVHDKPGDPITTERVYRFLSALGILLAYFPGWHAQVQEKDAEGVHLILILDELVLLDDIVASVREKLRALDEKYTGLGLADLEIYPDSSQGYRMPLGRGRVVLIDRPLVPVKNRLGRLVGDLKSYAAWLGDPQRNYMPADEVYQYVRERIKKPLTRKQPEAVTTPASTPGCGDRISFKGTTRRLIVDYWTGTDTTRGILNKMIGVTARLLSVEVGEEEAVEILERYCDELPDQGVSSRLRSDRKEVSRDIRRIVGRVYRDNGGQVDPATSSSKLNAVRRAWDQIDFWISDKKTWAINLPSLRSDGAGVGATPAFGWTTEEEGLIERNIMPVLNVVVRDSTSTKTRPPRDRKAEQKTACDVTREIVETVHRYRHGEVSATLIDTILAKYRIKLGSGHTKRTRLMEVLDRLGWVVEVAKPWAKRRAKRYAVGEMLSYKYTATDCCIPRSIYCTTFPQGGEGEAVGRQDTAAEDKLLLPYTLAAEIGNEVLC